MEHDIATASADARQISLCEHCRAQDTDVWFGPGHDHELRDEGIVLGSIERSLQSKDTCCLCNFFIEALEMATPVQDWWHLYLDKSEQLSIARMSLIKNWWSAMGLKSEASPARYCTLWRAKNQLREGRVCITSDRFDGLKPRCNPRSAKAATQLDLDLAYKWLADCRQHKDCQRERLDCGRMFLINVKERRLVEAQAFPYVALSYVWGPSAQNHWSWAVGQLPAAIPKTIEDAMTLTAAMGERYLWVDYYCINQKDASHVTDQISRMAKVYGSAEVTIICLDGRTADAGIAGISRPMRQKYQPQVRLANETLTATWIPNQRYGSRPWDERAWTMQENLLSERLLIIDKNQMHWQCRTQHLQDSIPRSEWTFRKLPASFVDGCDALDIGRDYLSFKEYCRFVPRYTKRHLTYQDDILKACSGILERTSQSKGREWLYGLPEDQFLASLYFEPDLECVFSRRAGFPSWSWAGWIGEATYSNNLIDLTDRFKQHSAEVTDSQPRTPLWKVQGDKLNITSFVADFHAQRNWKHGEVPSNHPNMHAVVGDVWDLVDSNGTVIEGARTDSKNNNDRGHHFRLAPEISELVLSNGKVSILALGCVQLDERGTPDWRGTESRSWNTVPSLILLRQDAGHMLRIARINLSRTVFEQANAKWMEIIIE